jgi:hypothetical protein
MARKRMSRKWPFLGNKCFKRGCKAPIVRKRAKNTARRVGRAKRRFKRNLKEGKPCLGKRFNSFQA